MFKLTQAAAGIAAALLAFRPLTFRSEVSLISVLP